MSAPLWNGPHTKLRTTLTPYLTLPHLLSQTWLAAPILSLIFVAFRLQLSLSDAQNALAKTKVNLLASCLAAEQAATSTVSMPRYMALATNRQFAQAVNGSVEAARLTLILSITVLEAIINFVIDIYRSTFLCLLELVVRGGLSILLGTVQQINQAVQTAATGVRSTFEQQVTSANSLIQTAVDAANKINPFNKITAPVITVPNLDSFENPSFASSFQDSLVKLNDTIPSSSEVKQKLQDILNTPFELLKKEINDTFRGLSFNPDGLPIPAQKGVTFCERLDTSVVDDLGADLLKTVKIGALFLLAAAVVLISLNCLLTWFRWRCMKSHFEYTRQAWRTDPTIIHSDSRGPAPQVALNDHNLMLLGADFQNPFITRIMNQVATRFRFSPRQHIHTRWFLQYIFHAPAIACLLIGVFGVLSIELQLLAMGPLVAKYRGRAQSAVSDFNVLIASTINSSMQNQSTTYANEVNGRVDNMQSTINTGLFGWVNGTTTTLNNTINAVYTDVQKAVTLVFGGTILETPAQQFVKCLIGTKVEAVENAITFLHDNLNVDLPRVNQNVLVLSPERVDEATKPIAAAAIGGGTNDDEGFLGQVIQSYVASLKKERLMFIIFICLWGLVVLLGLAIVIWHSSRKAKNTEQEQVSELANFPNDNEKGGNDLKFDPPPSKRVSLESLWLHTKYPPTNSSTTSEVSVPLHKESATSRLLAAGRKAFSREPKPKEEPVRDTVSAGDRYRAWYAKFLSWLAMMNKESEPTSDEPEKSPPKPKVIPVTPEQESPRSPIDRSRFSTSPKPIQTPAWKSLAAPPKRLKQSPTFVPLPVPDIPAVRVIPERGSTPPPRITSKTPLLAEIMNFPIPLHTGFDNEPSPSRPTAPSRTQSISSVAMSSPRMIFYQTPLSPPPPPLVVQHLHAPVPVPRGRQPRPTPFGSQSWATTPRMTSFSPRASPPIPLTLRSSTNDESSQGGENTPMAGPFGTPDAANVGPFVTPFDDEFQVRKTDQPIPESVQKNTLLEPN